MSDTQSERAQQQDAHAIEPSTEAISRSDMRASTSPHLTLENVRVVAEGRPRGTGRLVCEVGPRTVTFHAKHILAGSTVAKAGDVGALVIPTWVALTLGLS